MKLGQIVSKMINEKGSKPKESEKNAKMLGINFRPKIFNLPTTTCSNLTAPLKATLH